MKAAAVRIKNVGRSKTGMDKVRSELDNRFHAGEFGTEVTGLVDDPIRGISIVYATEGSVRSARHRDSRPHFAGAGINMWNVDRTDFEPYCSTGFPITLGGTPYQLTAGHCFTGASSFNWGWPTAFASVQIPIGYSFGYRSTTTVNGALDRAAEGTQDSFGDWALMKSSTYAPRVYNCSNQTGYCSSLSVGAAPLCR